MSSPRQKKFCRGLDAFYRYDFGDDWWVSLTLERIFEDKELDGRELPRVLEGAGFGIVEDAGGIGGLCAIFLASAISKRPGASRVRRMKRNIWFLLLPVRNVTIGFAFRGKYNTMVSYIQHALSR